MALRRIALALALMLLSHDAFAQAGGGGKGAERKARFFVGPIQGRYRETAKSEVLNRTEGSGGKDISGLQLDLGGIYRDFEAALDFRSWVPEDFDALAKRTEIYFTVAYIWAKYPWVAPVLGFYRTTQTPGDGSEARAAFIDKNTSFIIGARTHMIPLKFGGGTHGVLVHAHALYLTTLEATRNFGTETDIGLGYTMSFGNSFHVGLTYGQWRNFFNAAKPDPDDEEKTLGVRQVNIARHFGLYLQL